MKPKTPMAVEQLEKATNPIKPVLQAILKERHFTDTNCVRKDH